MAPQQAQILHPAESLLVSRKFSPLNVAKMRLAQIRELAQSRGLKSVAKELIFFNRIAVVVEKDLSQIVARPEPLAAANLKVLEIDRDIVDSGKYQFSVRSRQLKASRYLDNGYGGFALVRGHEVIGDTWYVVPETISDPRLLHEDLRRFGFTSWQKTDVYTFDIFLAPTERKGGIAPAFQNNAMLMLRSKGYTKGFGFYWADNIPAHWCTRVTNKWKKVRDVSISRFLFFHKAVHQNEKQEREH